jgi:hypothetical protein
MKNKVKLYENTEKLHESHSMLTSHLVSGEKLAMSQPSLVFIVSLSGHDPQALLA